MPVVWISKGLVFRANPINASFKGSSSNRSATIQEKCGFCGILIPFRSHARDNTCQRLVVVKFVFGLIKVAIACMAHLAKEIKILWAYQLIQRSIAKWIRKSTNMYDRGCFGCLTHDQRRACCQFVCGCHLRDL